MNCKEIIDKMSEYIDGETDLELCTLIRSHIESCPSCRIFFQSFEKNIQICKELLKVDVPEETRVRLRQRLKDEYKKFSAQSE